jgi:ribosome-associated translation inhibitor RaiA
VNYEFVIKKFKHTKNLDAKLKKSLSKLEHTLKSFHIEKPVNVILEKMPTRKEFLAKITFHVPKHTISTHDTGYTPEQALHNAADDARDKVLKAKDRLKDIHERIRRSKDNGIRLKS